MYTTTMIMLVIMMLDAGRVADWCSWWSTTDSVPHRSSWNVKDNSSAGWRWTLPTAAVHHTYQAPQPGNDDPSTKTSLELSIRTRLSGVCFLIQCVVKKVVISFNFVLFLNAGVQVICCCWLSVFVSCVCVVMWLGWVTRKLSVKQWDCPP